MWPVCLICEYIKCCSCSFTQQFMLARRSLFVFYQCVITRTHMFALASKIFAFIKNELKSDKDTHCSVSLAHFYSIVY